MTSAQPARGDIHPADADRAPRSAAPNFSYQLADAYLYSCSVQRREAQEGDPSQPDFEVWFSNEERPYGFDATLRVQVTHRFRPEALCLVDVHTIGVFVGRPMVRQEDDERFRNSDAAVLLWPYSRAHVAELGAMMGIDLPPLPTIDVRGSLSAFHELGALPE